MNDLERQLGTHLYGRRRRETMVFWETAEPDADDPPAFSDYAEIWRAAEKVVHSRTLRARHDLRGRLSGTDPEC